MERKELCAFGIEAKKRLVELNKSSAWLAQSVAEDTGKYVDVPYLCRIWTGKRNPPKIIASICKILEIEEPGREAAHVNA